MKTDEELTLEQEQFARALGRILADRYLSEQRKIIDAGQPRGLHGPSTRNTKASGEE